MVLKAEEIAARLAPPADWDETPEADSLKAEIEAEANEIRALPKKDDPRHQAEWAFHLKWVDPAGKSWDGDFVTKILSIRERRLCGIMRARLANEVPLGSLDGLTAEINLMLAHLAFSLIKRPKWAENLESIHNPQVLREIYREVIGHEATFLGWGEAEG